MAILVLAAVLRLIGIRYGLPLSVLNPDESNIVPRAWRMGHGHLDPGWYDYPSLLMALLAPVQAFFGAPGARRRAVRRRRDRPRRRRGDLVARPARLRHRRRDRRCSSGRRRDDPRRVLADGGHRRAADARGHLRARARGRGRLEWAGLAVGLAASAKYPGAIAAVPVARGGVGEMACARPRRRRSRWPASRSRARSC